MPDTATITVTADEANTIINALAGRPYSEVADLLPRLAADFQTQFDGPREEGNT